MSLTTNKISCRILAELLEAHGVKDAVISPGSRNTPIILALDSNESINKHVVIDERCAAFVALGMAKSSNNPVAIICTSGTALLNYAPAVAEAYYHSIPLIVISADRPMQWIDQDDSQTIRQFEVLDNFVKKSYDIFDIDGSDEEMTWFVNRTINDAILTATSNRKGPIHLNVQLNQPLSQLTKVEEKYQRIINTIPTSQFIDNDILKKLVNSINNKRILIIGGFYGPNKELNDALIELSYFPNIKILSETITNINGTKINSNIDRTISWLSDEELNALKPEIVISFGGALVSRYIKQFLRSFKPLRHICVGYNHTTIDCFKSLTDKIEIPAEKFFNQLKSNIIHGESDYANRWETIEKLSLKSHISFLKEVKWSDFKAFDIIVSAINNTKTEYHLSVSNGTPIRYTQLFNIKNITNFTCNRGVSGIDGCTSTAIGIACKNKNTTLFITGDMSFAYDIGALGISFIPQNLKIIIINNHGGGIFRFIKSTKELPQREKYFSCDPNIPIKQLSDAYDFDYFYANDEQSLTKNISSFLNSEKRSILEIETPTEISAEILKNYMNRKI